MVSGLPVPFQGYDVIGKMAKCICMKESAFVQDTTQWG